MLEWSLTGVLRLALTGLECRWPCLERRSARGTRLKYQMPALDKESMSSLGSWLINNTPQHLFLDTKLSQSSTQLTNIIMAVTKKRGAAAAHVNMMTDTIIANLPADGLRVVMRSLLASCPEVTGTFEHETRRFLGHAAETSARTKIDTVDIGGLKQAQQIVRCMLGSGVPFQSIPLLKDMVARGAELALNSSVDSELESFLASVDSDIVQSMTAVKKTLFTNTGVRAMSTTEYAHIETLFESLVRCQDILQSTGKEYPYDRGLVTTASTLGIPPPAAQHAASNGKARQQPLPGKAKETFVLGDRTLPRIFSGLWQMSSAAWGSAPTSRIVEQFSTHVQSGFTAFDMADHYGDAEVIFVSCFSPIPRHCGTLTTVGTLPILVPSQGCHLYRYKVLHLPSCRHHS